MSRIFSENENLNLEIEAFKNTVQRQEDYCFALVEAISEVELQLELVGRNHETLTNVIEKFERNVQLIHKKFKISYFDSMNKILSQIYKNQIKAIDSIGKPTKSTETDAELNFDSLQSLESIPCSSVAIQECQNQAFPSNDQSHYQSSADEGLSASEKDEKLFTEITFDEFDIEAINYILLAKHFNLKSTLEVVHEVEEEEEEEDCDEEQDYEDDVESVAEDEMYEYSQDSVFEHCNDCKTKPHENNEEENQITIDESVKSLISDILDEVERSVSRTSIDNLEITQEFDNFGIERQDISRNSIDSAFAKTTESDVNETKPQNIDSDLRV